jgi:phospho-N-acetylmuramoyl-pentapeptide-transferase
MEDIMFTIEPWSTIKFMMPLWGTFFLSLVCCMMGLPILKKLKMGQYVRDDGPQTHLKKAGTPVMGGLLFLLPMAIVCAFYVRACPSIGIVIFCTLAFGLIGFIDDFTKMVMKRSMGLHAWQKIVLQLIVTIIFFYVYMHLLGGKSEIILLNGSGFENPSIIKMPVWLFFCFVFLVMVGTVNATNLTDGLDGLSSSVTVVVVLFFAIASRLEESLLSVPCLALAGGLLAFLCFNAYPAKVFMGDTGSLALGGLISSVAFLLHIPLLIVIVGLIYLIEVLSVVIQVGYFKITHGKRFFKMAPIHHHFEQCGYSETRIVTIFTIITILLCSLALTLF